MARVILVRHGQTEWNRIERFRGRADVPSRALVTAQRIAEPHGLEVRIHSGLIDIDYGRWQGLTPEEAAEPCAINTFAVENGEFTLVCLNDTCHLEDLS